ncbi:MAG TPA: hypothetical protein VFV54_02025, partial [Thermoanaerobaculia bacterium]|nr:hypothetical protein [Thermoanaerobaculia bacterium]
MANGVGAAVVRGAAVVLIAALAPLHAATSEAAARAAIRDEMLARINADRRDAGIPAVRLDEVLSGPADRYCELQLAERTVGHFAMDGLAPYVRYSQAGVNDGIAENAVAWSAKYSFTSPGVLDLARRSHAAMMAEAPPRDSHRRTILDPHATHVAIGSAWAGGEFRLVQIFVRRYIEWTAPPPRRARAGDRIRAAGKAPAGWDVAGVSIHWEPIPARLSREGANRIESYALPPPFRELQPRRASRGPAEKKTLSGWVASGGQDGALLLAPAGGFSVAAPLDRGAGIYTLVVWLREGA